MFRAPVVVDSSPNLHVVVTDVDEVVTDVVEELGDERSRSHPGDVGLGDADHPLDVAEPDPGAGGGAARHRIRRGHERIRPVIEVERRPLCALEEHVPAFPERGADLGPDVGCDLEQAIAQGERLLHGPVELLRTRTELLQPRHDPAPGGVDPLRQPLGVE